MTSFDPGQPDGDLPGNDPSSRHQRPADDHRPADDGESSGGQRLTVLRFAGAGMELAAMVLGAGFIGHLLDRNVFQAERPWGLIGGMLLGFAAAMGHLFVLAKRFNR